MKAGLGRGGFEKSIRKRLGPEGKFLKASLKRKSSNKCLG